MQSAAAERAEKAKWQLLRYLTSPECRLFQGQNTVQLADKEVGHLLHAVGMGNIDQAIVTLRLMDSSGLRFKSLKELAERMSEGFNARLAFTVEAHHLPLPTGRIDQPARCYVAALYHLRRCGTLSCCVCVGVCTIFCGAFVCKHVIVRPAYSFEKTKQKALLVCWDSSYVLWVPLHKLIELLFTVDDGIRVSMVRSHSMELRLLLT